MLSTGPLARLRIASRPLRLRMQRSLPGSTVKIRLVKQDLSGAAAGRRIQLREAAFGKPPPPTGTALKEGRGKHRFFVQGPRASRAGRRLHRDGPGDHPGRRLSKRAVVLHEQVDFSSIQPETMLVGTDVELRPFKRRNLDEILVTVRTLHMACQPALLNCSKWG